MPEDVTPLKAEAGIPKAIEQDEFWIEFGKSLISESIKTLDDRAQFMITTCASLLAADFAILTLTSNIGLATVTPQLFFPIAVLFFILSLFPRKIVINAWTPDDTRVAYKRIIDYKHRFHKIGFLFFFIALVLVAISSFFIISQ